MIIVWIVEFCLFFFQAEDGIRDLTVTGVQTCALPISLSKRADLFHRLRAVLRLEEKNPTAKKLHQIRAALQGLKASLRRKRPERDRKSTRLNSSHSQISYAVFCLKKQNRLLPTILNIPQP